MHHRWWIVTEVWLAALQIVAMFCLQYPCVTLFSQLENIGRNETVLERMGKQDGMRVNRVFSYRQAHVMANIKGDVVPLTHRTVTGVRVQG